MTCTTIISYSVLVNGIPTNPFDSKKCLKQGDPLYLLLFTIGMEYMSRCMNTLHHGPHPRCKSVKLAHLMFVDELLLFRKANTMLVKALYAQFRKFSLNSRIKANPEKCKIYFC